MKADACFKLLGRYIGFSINNEKKVGRLVGVFIDTDEHMRVKMDENGFYEEYELSDVNILSNKSNQKTLAEQIIKQVHKDINSFKSDLGEYRKNEISEALQKIQDQGTLEKVIHGLGIGTKNVTCEDIYKSVATEMLAEEEKDLICGIVAYKQHDANEAYRIFCKRWCYNKTDSDACRDLILVAKEFSNDVLCFFLLKHFFKINNTYINDKYYINLWWQFIHYSVKYNNFDFLVDVHINRWNVRTLIDSFIYIFHMYNLDHLAKRITTQFNKGNNPILQRNNEDIGDIDNAINELNLFKNYLPETAEGYYLRAEHCIEHILEDYDGNTAVNSGEYRGGYVYEFVKFRSYGFILGIDLQEYFFHEDSLSPITKKRIIDTFYSGKAISDEEMVYVHFSCEEKSGKRQALQAFNID